VAELHAHTHNLGRAEFDQLASAHSAPSVMETLHRSRISRSLLLLTRVSADADQPAAVRLLSRAHDRDTAAVNRLLASPSVAGWLAACIRDRGQHAGRLASLALAAAAHANLPDARIIVAPVGGAVMVPTFGLLRLTEPTTVGVGDLAGPLWQPMRTVQAVHGPRRISVAIDDLDPFRGYPGAALLPRLSDDDHEQLQSRFAETWSMLCRWSPQRADELQRGLLALVPLAAEGMMQSATYADAFGAVMMTMPHSSLELIEVLVHEVAHSKLAAMHALSPLVVAGHNGTYTAAWKAGPRRLDRLLQGIFAFTSVGLLWNDLRADEAVRVFATEQMAMRAEQVSQALRQVTADPSGLTTHGRRLVDRISATVETMLRARES